MNHCGEAAWVARHPLGGPVYSKQKMHRNGQTNMFWQLNRSKRKRVKNMPIDHDKLHPWPAELPDGPLATMRHLLHLARHPDEVDVRREFHFAWHLAGFAGASFDPHTHQGSAATPEGQILFLQSWVNEQEQIAASADPARPAVAAIPWVIVLPIIIDVVIRWLLDRWQAPPKP